MEWQRSPLQRGPEVRAYNDTPFFATEYTLRHMGLDPAVRPSITTAEYEAGHMMYIHIGCLERLKRDVSDFLHEALQRNPE